MYIYSHMSLAHLVDLDASPRVNLILELYWNGTRRHAQRMFNLTRNLFFIMAMPEKPCSKVEGIEEQKILDTFLTLLDTTLP